MAVTPGLSLDSLIKRASFGASDCKRVDWPARIGLPRAAARIRVHQVDSRKLPDTSGQFEDVWWREDGNRLTYIAEQQGES